MASRRFSGNMSLSASPFFSINMPFSINQLGGSGLLSARYGPKRSSVSCARRNVATVMRPSVKIRVLSW